MYRYVIIVTERDQVMKVYVEQNVESARISARTIKENMFRRRKDCNWKHDRVRVWVWDSKKSKMIDQYPS